MRRENLPVGGHDKVTWERSRNHSRDKASRQRNSETWWRRTTATLLGVSFGSYRRRRRDVLMGRGGYVPLRRLSDVPLRRHWVFHLRLVWDVVKTYHWDVLVTYHWDVLGCFIWDLFETSWRRTTEKSWRRSTETSLGVSFERHLRRRWVHCVTVFFWMFHSIYTL